MLKRRAWSTAFWAFFVLTSLVLFPIALIIWTTTIVDPRGVLLHRFTCFWGSLYTWVNPAWRIRIEGKEKIRRGTPYVMIANHQSFLDILVLLRLFTHFKWVSKAENFRIPIVGWHMALNRYIKLKRGDRASIEQMMRESERTLRAGSSVMIFPEGTRSPDGRLQRFKSGAFRLALRARVPLLLIAVEGTAQALPKRGFVLQGRHHISIRILGEVPYESFAETSADELAERIHDRFAAELRVKPTNAGDGPRDRHGTGPGANASRQGNNHSRSP